LNRGLWALLFWLFVGCTDFSSPRKVAEGYLGALSQLDFPAAAQFVTDEGTSNFETLRKVYEGLGPDEQKKFLVSDAVVTGETITGDVATVDFTFDQVKHGQLSLRRTGGQWKVDHRTTF